MINAQNPTILPSLPPARPLDERNEKITNSAQTKDRQPREIKRDQGISTANPANAAKKRSKRSNKSKCELIQPSDGLITCGKTCIAKLLTKILLKPFIFSQQIRSN